MVPRLYLRSALVVLGVVCGTHKVKRDVRLVADNPTIVAGGNVEEVPGFHLDDAPVGHCCDGFPRDDQTHMLDGALPEAGRCTDIERPFPAGVVGRASDGHAADVDQLEFSTSECASFVRLIKALQDDIEHKEPPRLDAVARLTVDGII